MKADRPLRLVSSVVCLVLAFASCTSNRGADAPTMTGLALEPAPDVSALSLPDAGNGGAPFRTRAAPGGLLLVYFGYTSCPDVCPTTMSDLRVAESSLTEAQQGRVRFAMVTIDPSRDSDELLTRYVRSFAADGHALRTEDATELRAAAAAFGADFGVKDGGMGQPEVLHTGWVYVVDDRGRLRLQWPFGTTSEDMASDLRVLLTEAVGRA